MRTLVQFPLTAEQQRAYDVWVSSLCFHNGYTEVVAEQRASDMVAMEDGHKYWATRSHRHFCQYASMNAGWYSCMGCWTD
jgi:hypothetical protein